MLSGVGYSSSGSFNSAVASATSKTVEDFGTVTPNTVIPNGTSLDGIIYSFQLSEGFPAGVTTGGNSISGNSLTLVGASTAFLPGDVITMTFPTAVNFVAVFSNTFVPTAYTLTLGADSTTNHATTSDTSSFVFTGLISATASTTATFQELTTSSNQYGIPEIIYGTLPTASPAPVDTIGGLDPNFGVNGLASHDLGFSATDNLAVQNDGKSVILGTAGAVGAQSIGLTRYNANGSLDGNFGNNGVIISSLGGSDQPAGLSLLPNGDILVVGTASGQFLLAEYTPAGNLDTSFGGGTGYVVTSISGSGGALSPDTANALVVAPDGIIYVGGSSDAAAKGLDFAVAAYNADGSVDTSFGGTGTTLLDFSGGDDSINAMTLQTNGDLVAVGSSVNPSSGIASIALTRFLPNGAVDSHFGTKGKVITNVRGVADIASSVAIDHTGKIVVGGLSATGSASDGSLSSDFVVARYTTAGLIDRTFGRGPVITSFGQPSAVSRVLIQSDGNIVASGKTVTSLSGLDPSHLEVALARYTPKGTLDTTFNGTGMAVISLSGTSASSAAKSAGTGGNIGPASVSPFALATFSVPSSLSPADTASTLIDEFQKFEASAQGTVAVTQGGELLVAGNSGSNTVEAAIISAGVDLAASLIAKLPPAVLQGAKETLSVKIAESGTDPAVGTVTIQLYASPDGQVDFGLLPFQSTNERVNLKTGQSHTFSIRYALTTVGDYYVLANVVENGSLSDLNVNNNAVAAGSQVHVAPPFVDLAGSGLVSVGTPTVGKLATITFTVANNGNVPARSAPVEILASPDGTVANGTQVAEPTLLLSLPFGVTRKYRLTFKLPSTLAAATYVFVAVLDPANMLNDSNLANNVIVGMTQFTVA